MSTPNSVNPETKLTRSDRIAIRKQEIRDAEHTGRRAYQFAWDAGQKVQITGFPDGRATIEKVDVGGLSLEPRKLLTRWGVPTRWLGVGSLAIVLAADLASRVL